MQVQENAKIFEVLGKAQNILIALPKNPNADTLGSALALSKFIKKIGKHVDVLCEKKEFSNLAFLPGSNEIKSEIILSNDFVISVSTAETKLEELSYYSEAEQVHIHLKPQSGNFSEKDLSFNKSQALYDLIICVDTPSLEYLGDLYAKNAEIFFRTPKINIDNHINNENYGNINLVDITAASTAEMLLDLLKSYEQNLIDSEIATCLLTGIISKTNSFQHSNTTPNSFLYASELIGYGAQQQEIIQYLFKTKSIGMLKLFGRAMAKIKYLSNGVVLSATTILDLEKSTANEEDVLKVGEELAANLNDLKLLFFSHEVSGGLEIHVYSGANIKLAEVINHFGGILVAPNSGRILLKDTKSEQLEQILTEALNNLKTRIGL